MRNTVSWRSLDRV